MSNRGTGEDLPAGHAGADLAAQIFPGKGEMASLIRATDWSKTPLGPVQTWPQSLRTAVSICLGSRHPIVLWWGPERWMFYNDGYRPMLGAKKHPQFLGASGQACWAEIWDVIGPMMDQVIDTGEATWSENLFLLMLRHGYLEETYFTFSYSPILDEVGRPSGIFNACTETTARVLAERRMKTLRELTVEVRRVDEAARLCAEILSRNRQDVPFALVYLLDRDGKHLRLEGWAGLQPGTPASPANVATAKRDDGGWPLARVAARGCAEVVADLTDRFDCLPKEPWDEAPKQAMLMPIAHPGSAEPAGVLVLGISPRRAFDDDYRGFFELVASHVATAVANARVYEIERERADKLAELDRVKTAFFSNVSHEFRTPLTLILGPLEEALADPAKMLRGEALELVHRNALRLLKLVNSLLDFSRVEADRLRALFRPTDLPALTAGLAGAFQSLMTSAGLELIVDCPAVSEPVYVDPSQWEKIVLNLISNAFKFTFKGKIAVRLHTTEDHIELSVSDTGTGIPEHELPRVFERFHRIEGARGRSFEGTGIGLALVQELVRQHGGAVRVESVVGKGTTFIVAIPRGTAHLPTDRIVSDGPDLAVANAAPYLLEASQWVAPERTAMEVLAVNSSTPTAAAEPVDISRRGRVLVADDNADMREYLVRLLALHWNVEAVEDGLAAFKSALRQTPDLVLSDVMMPRMDGIELLRALRADPRTHTIPVVLLSARAGEEAVVAGLGTGADDYLAKPFSANELLARVRTHIEMSVLRREWADRIETLNAALRTSFVEAQAARDEAVAASRAKSEFLAAMSHEVRTPLNAVIGFAGLLAEGNLTLQHREFAEAIRSSAEHLLGIISDILDFSKMQSGRFDLAPAPFALRTMIESAMDFVAGKASEKGLEVAYVMAPGVPAGLEADKARLRQILINYLSNAVKFTAKGEVVLEVESTPLGEGGRHEFHFTVRDTGMGIPADRMDRLFHEFSQVDPSIATDFGGTGLGLAICKKLAELHGGRVWAESEPGVGSSFHFSLSSKACPEAGAVAFPVSDSLRGLRVLIVDDNRTNVAILRAQAESWGMHARATESPIEALAWLERGEAFDLVITDHDMPVMDGVQLAKSIRHLPGGANVPIVLFSSVSNSVRVAREFIGLFAAVWTKPIRQSELFNRLGEVVHSSRPREPAVLRSASVSTLSILIAEDNHMNQMVELALLESLGYRADVVGDGEQVLVALERTAYDVILMDMQMSKLDGIQATKAIRAQGSTVRQPRIIAMTARAMNGDREACLAAGMDDYVSKPIERRELADALRKAALHFEVRA